MKKAHTLQRQCLQILVLLVLLCCGAGVRADLILDIPTDGFTPYYDSGQVVRLGNAVGTDQYAQPSSGFLALTQDGRRNEAGAGFWGGTVDVSNGFDTQFRYRVLHVTPDGQIADGFAFIVGDRAAVGAAGGGIGYDRAIKGMAIEFDTYHNTESTTFDWPAPSVTIHGSNYFNGNGFLTADEGYYTLGTKQVAMSSLQGDHLGRVRYIPTTHTLEVYIDGNLQLRNSSFNLGDWLADPTKAHVGFTGATGGLTSGNHIRSWALRNDPGVDAYSELLVFKKDKQSIWSQNDSGYAEWNQVYETTWDVPETTFGSSSDVPVLGHFAGSGKAKSSGRVGLRFYAKADGGQADINYPLYLRLVPPAQKSLNPGDTFQLATSFKPDAIASLVANSPSALFQTYLRLGTEDSSKKTANLSLKAEAFSKTLLDSTIADFRIPYHETDIIDTDWLIKSGILQFIDSTDFKRGDGSFSIQDGEGTKDGSPKGKNRGQKGKGTTKGAGKGKFPSSFIDGTFRFPRVDVNASVGSDFSSPNSITGSASDRFFNIHSDFTEALFDLIDFPIPLNLDFGIDLGSVGSYSAGYHIADFYGDINLGMKLDYRLDVRPKVRFEVTDGISTWYVPAPDNTGFTYYDLTNDPIDRGAFAMPASGRPLTITPIVRLANTFYNTPTLLVSGALGFNAFSVYLQIPQLPSIDSTNTIVPVYSIPLFDARPGIPKYSFEVGFTEAAARPITLYPAGSSDPLIYYATPNQAATGSSTIAVTLKGEDLVLLGNSAYTSVVFNAGRSDQRQLPVVSVDSDQIVVRMPADLLTAPGVKSLTVVENNGYLYKTSNAVDFTVQNPVPVIGALEPGIFAGVVPTDLADNPLLDNSDTPGFTLTIYGSKFAPGAVVRWNGSALPTTYVSPTQVTAHVTASLVQLPSQVSITVVNSGPGGGESAPAAYTLRTQVPVLTSLSQFATNVNVPGLTLTVYGKKFLPTAVVYWNGRPRQTTFLSSNRVTAEILPEDLASVGIGQVQVINGQYASDPLQVKIQESPARAVLKIDPVLTRDSRTQEVVLTLRVTNIGTVTAENMAIGYAALLDAKNVATQTNASMPLSIGMLAPGAVYTAPAGLRFPASVGTRDKVFTLSISGSYSNGTYNSKTRVALP